MAKPVKLVTIIGNIFDNIYCRKFFIASQNFIKTIFNKVVEDSCDKHLTVIYVLCQDTLLIKNTNKLSG